jgi:hypothetical protein
MIRGWYNRPVVAAVPKDPPHKLKKMELCLVEHNTLQSFWYWSHHWPIVPAPDDRWWWLWRNWWNGNWQGKPKYSEKTCPRATLSATNPTRLDPGLNPGRRDGKPSTNLLIYGAAPQFHLGTLVSFSTYVHSFFLISLVGPCLRFQFPCTALPISQTSHTGLVQFLSTFRLHEREYQIKAKRDMQT